jgi:hypothetical protein
MYWRLVRANSVSIIEGGRQLILFAGASERGAGEPRTGVSSFLSPARAPCRLFKDALGFSPCGHERGFCDRGLASVVSPQVHERRAGD